MNHFDWEDSVQRWQNGMKTHQKDSGWMESPGGRHNSRTFYQSRADTADDPPSRLTVQSGPAGQCPSKNNFHIEKAQLCEPDGNPFDADQMDYDLTRKIKELRKLEESIRRQKGEIGCKTVVEPSAAACDEEPGICTTGATLKDRVDGILQQRQSNSFLSKSHFHKHRIKPSGSQDEKQQEDHPLKMRVNALMKHRRCRPCVSPSNTKPPPQRIVSSPTVESSSDQGFQRFLDVLNKGVDVNLLTRIVNEDSADLCLDGKGPDEQQQRASESPFRSRSQYSNDGISLPEHSGSRERSRERPPGDLMADNNENNKAELPPFRSKTSSDSVSGMKEQKGDEDRIKQNEQHEQLQNVLKSLGLQLEVEEISKLANRTQERLYGKKSDTVNAESRREPDREPKHSPRSNRSSSSCSSSSSSSCSSSSSRSSSQSRSSSSSYSGTSQCKASGCRRASRSNSSRERSWEKRTLQENSQGREKRPKDSNQDGENFRDQDSYTQFPTCPPPNPSYAFPPIAVAQYSQYSTCGPYQDAVTSYWTYSQAPVYPPFYPSSQPYTQEQCPQFPIAVLDTRNLPRQAPISRPLDQRCLKAILPNPGDNRVQEEQTNKKTMKKMQKLQNLQKLQEPQNRKNPTCRKRKRARGKRKKAKRKKVKQMQEKLKAAAVKAKVTAEGDQPLAPKKEEQQIPELPCSEPATFSQPLERRHSIRIRNSTKCHGLTEEEIKANLRKTLEEFNKMAKQRVIQPVSSLTCQTDEDLLKQP